GEEITVDVFCNSVSKPLVISPRIRLAVKSGQTVKGETIDSVRFIDAVQKICGLVQMKGVCNIQFFLSKGQLIFLEINPRFAAGGLMLTVAAGANIPLLVLKSILNFDVDEVECQVKKGLKMTRYWEEIII
ncbi:MAG TPA: ATP-grasp domain-containing protein, partial [Bacteroidia bacterium]